MKSYNINLVQHMTVLDCTPINFIFMKTLSLVFLVNCLSVVGPPTSDFWTNPVGPNPVGPATENVDLQRTLLASYR